MKVVILAGGYGTRIGEESQYRPKPMVEIGNMPILVHIMKHYAHYGNNEFIISAGYKQNVIKEYFAHYFLNNSDVVFDFTNGNNDMTLYSSPIDHWKVTVSDTGLNTMTGGRVKRMKEYIGNEPFMLTYGDGVSDIDLHALEKYHRTHGKMVTISCYDLGRRFGVLDVAENGKVNEFREKIVGNENLINIGFMVCEPEFLDLIDGDDTMLERAPLETAARIGQLMAYRHQGFWQCMDTIREKEILDEYWKSGKAPWKVWED